MAKEITVLDVVMDQREVVHQLHGGPCRQGQPVIAPRRLARQQNEEGPEALALAVLHRLPFLVYPAKLVEHHAVEGGFALGEDIPKLLLDLLLVLAELGR